MKASGTGWHMNHIGSLGCMYFTGQPVVDYASAKQADTKRIRKVVPYMLQKGYYFGPSQFEAMFLSAAHTKEELQGGAGCCKDILCRKGMMHLVTGGSGSGKSAYAEQQVLEAGMHRATISRR